MQYRTHISENGRISIPAPLRKMLHLQPKEALLLSVNDRGICIRPSADVIRGVQAAFAERLQDGPYLSEERIAERHLEVARDE